MRPIRFSPDADDDLERIRRETRKLWGRVGVERFDLTLTARLLSLSVNPRMGPPRAEIHPDLRSLSLPPFVVLYRVARRSIEIVRVFDGRRDYPSILRVSPRPTKGD
ncbi:MAG: type II toxin-antitoxin system RelE/ParE family toxin [Rhodospirillaceae bacterium]|nr:type II toxin-antitoxin system RelE/ParE family toxin [Rhodospirillaceae bacterium]